jgi:hypothetical protein
MSISATADFLPNILQLFRKSVDPDQGADANESEDLKNSTQRIRCPICKWPPNRFSRWTCWDCGHPEYYFEGCGTEWNTFDTGGVCPGCSHKWIWTTCLSCWGWSKHEDWYEETGEK